MASFDFKKLLPHLYIIIGFIVVAALFSYPQFDGMELRQSDNVSWKASAKEAMDWHEEKGENTLWSNSMFGGMPTFTYYVPETNNYIAFIQTGIMNIMGKPAGFLVLAMLGFYVLMIVMGINRWLAVAGCLAYAFSTYNITLIEAGHETKMWALAYMPAVIGGLMLLYRGRWWSGIPVLGLSLALLMTTGHYQIAYYTIIIIIGMVIVYFIDALREKQLKRFFIASGIAMIVAVISVGPTMQLLMATIEYNKTTMRGGESELTLNHDQDKQTGGLDKEYAFRWSNAWGESFTVLVPMLYGGASAESLGDGSNTYEVMTDLGVPAQSAEGFAMNLPTYWGPQPFTGGPFYFGAIICFLFVLGVMIIKSRHKWWIVAVCILAFLMSLGYNFKALNYFLFDTLPGFNKFRVPNMILVIPQMLFPLLAIWALNDALNDKLSKEELWKKVKQAGIITGVLVLLLSVGGRMFFSFEGENDIRLQQQLTQSFQNEDAARQVLGAIQDDRAAMAMQSGIISLVFIALIFGLLWAYTQNKLKGQYVAFAVIVLIAIDLIRVDVRYLNEENYVYEDEYEQLFAPRQVDVQVKQMAGDDPFYRVLDLSRNTYNDAIQSVHHKAIGGYSPAKMEVYQDLIDIHMNGQTFNRQVLNMLNTRFVITTGGQQGAQPFVAPNPDANGNAWFVSEIKWVETADEEMLSMNEADPADSTNTGFNSKETAIVRTKYKDKLEGYNIGKDSNAYVKLTRYGLNDMGYESSNTKDGFAVFSDIYYPYGWEAYIDGEQVDIIKVNYLLRGLKIPAGQHEIEFKFHPQTFYTGDKIAMVSSILLILVTVGSIAVSFRKKNTA